MENGCISCSKGEEMKNPKAKLIKTMNELPPNSFWKTKWHNQELYVWIHGYDFHIGGYLSTRCLAFRFHTEPDKDNQQMTWEILPGWCFVGREREGAKQIEQPEFFQIEKKLIEGFLKVDQLSAKLFVLDEEKDETYKEDKEKAENLFKEMEAIVIRQKPITFQELSNGQKYLYFLNGGTVLRIGEIKEKENERQCSVIKSRQLTLSQETNLFSVESQKRRIFTLISEPEYEFHIGDVNEKFYILIDKQFQDINSLFDEMREVYKKIMKND